MRKTISKGYKAVPKTRQQILSQKYPFRLLKPGQFVTEPYPWEEVHRVRAAVRYYNRKNNWCLHISPYPQGTKEHPEPHLLVGRVAAVDLMA